MPQCSSIRASLSYNVYFDYFFETIVQLPYTYSRYANECTIQQKYVALAWFSYSTNYPCTVSAVTRLPVLYSMGYVLLAAPLNFCATIIQLYVCRRRYTYRILSKCFYVNLNLHINKPYRRPSACTQCHAVRCFLFLRAVFSFCSGCKRCTQQVGSKVTFYGSKGKLSSVAVDLLCTRVNK